MHAEIIFRAIKRMKCFKKRDGSRSEKLEEVKRLSRDVFGGVCNVKSCVRSSHGGAVIGAAMQQLIIERMSAFLG